MKSKAFILSEIKELLHENKGLLEDEAQELLEEYQHKTIFELLVLKKELGTVLEYPDVSCLRAVFRE